MHEHPSFMRLVRDDPQVWLLNGHGVVVIPGFLDWLRQRPYWLTAVATVGQWIAMDKLWVDARVTEMQGAYQGFRAAIVIDVVLSYQRDYENFVLPTVRTWKEGHPEMTLRQLGQIGPGPLPRRPFDQRPFEEPLVQNIAANLSEYCEAHGLDEDAGVTRWATETEPLRFTPLLDHLVGAVREIGPTCLAHARLLSGADAIWPDRRVEMAVREFGIPVPIAAPITLLAVTEALAEELKVSRLFMDQFLRMT